jgi:hypothetical protein
LTVLVEVRFSRDVLDCSGYIGDDGVKQLATLKNLKILDLAFTNVSDAGLMELSAIPGLTHLGLGGTNVSNAGRKEFERRNPKCNLSVPLWSEAIKR